MQKNCFKRVVFFAKFLTKKLTDEKMVVFLANQLLINAGSIIYTIIGFFVRREGEKEIFNRFFIVLNVLVLMTL